MAKTVIHHGEQFKYLVDHSNVNSVAIIAHRMKISHTAIYNMYKRKEMDPRLIENICDIFSVDPDEFRNKKLTGLKYVLKEEYISPESNKEIVRLMAEVSELKSQLIQSKDEIIELSKKLIGKGK